MHSVEKASKNRNAGPIDFSLFTDGLRAEREQGITIDVAYRYFATARRKFILADTPGHEQYTRNMATGASTADVAILLVDARNGVRAQSRRHARIARLLGITDFVLAVNKMDLVDFDRDVFDDDPRRLRARSSPGARVHAIPMSALHGDNVITRSERTPWFDGPACSSILETVQVDARPAGAAVPLPGAARAPAGPGVPRLRRADRRRARSASAIASPPGRPAAPRASSRIVTFDGDLDDAFAPMSVTLTLDDEIDISRGDMLTIEPPTVGAASSRPTSSGWTSGRSTRGASICSSTSTRTVTAEIDHGAGAEPDRHGERLDRAAAGVRSLRREPRHRQLHPHRPGHALHRRRGHDHQPAARRGEARVTAPISAAERLALLARHAAIRRGSGRSRSARRSRRC